MITTNAAPAALRTFRFLGNTDEVDTCDCCGRKDLKSTVALENLDDGQVVHFGVVCAARAIGATSKEVRSAARRADDERIRAEAAARAAADAAAYNAMQAWLDARLPQLRGQRFEQLQALGGMKVVREMFAAASVSA